MKGIWFYGLSGAGKTAAAEHYASLIDNAFIIDGDMVRKYISTDLGYTEADREIQIRRILGLSQLTINNDYFPIASTVFMDEETLKKSQDIGLRVIEVTRQFSALEKVRDLYKSCADDVVGKTIKLPDLNTEKLHNCGSELFFEKIGEL